MTLRDLAYDSTQVQRRFTLGVALAGMVLATICAGLANVDWASWQWAIVLFVAFDLIGGVAAMTMPPAIRKLRPPDEPLRPVLFAAFHVHPFVIYLALPEIEIETMAVLYGFAVAGVAALNLLPVRQHRSALALAWCAGALSILALLDGSVGLEWLAPAYMLKLTGSHSVPTAE